jgi:hypothetical protein
MTPARPGYRRLEACRYWDISPRTWDRLRAAGIIPDPDIRIGSIKMWSHAVVSGLFRVESQKQTRSTRTR